MIRFRSNRHAFVSLLLILGTSLLTACCLFGPKEEKPSSGPSGAPSAAALNQPKSGAPPPAPTSTDDVTSDEGPPIVRGKARFKVKDPPLVAIKLETEESGKGKIASLKVYVQRYEENTNTYSYPSKPDYEPARSPADPSVWDVPEFETTEGWVNELYGDDPYIWVRVDTYDASNVLLGQFVKDFIVDDGYYVEMDVYIP